MKIKLLFAQLFLLILCSTQLNAQTTDLVKYLPEKAAMIMDIDGSSLSQKVSWKELMAMKMFDSLLKKAEPGTRKMIAEPSETGINFSDHLYFVVDMNEEQRDKTGNVAIYGRVLDENKLTQLIDKAKIKEVTRKNFGENKMIFGKDFLFGWNRSVFVLHTGTSFFNEFEHSAKQSPNEKKKELARLEKKCIELLTPKTKNIYTANKHFENLTNQKADMRIWIETDMLNSVRKGKNPFTMFNMGGVGQGKYRTAIVNFEKGKIVSTGYTYFDDDVSSSIKKIYADKLNAELIKKLPEGNLLGLFSMSFKPEAFEELLEKTGLWEEFKKMDKEAQIDPKSLLDNLKGDVLMAFSMSEMPGEVEEGSEKNPFAGMQVYFAATVKDEKKMNQFIDSIKALIEEKKKSRYEDEGLSDTTIIEESVPDVAFPDSLVVLDSLKILQDSLIMMDEEVFRPRKNDMFKGLKPAIRVDNGVFLLSLSDEHLSKFGVKPNNAHDKLISEYSKYPMLMVIDLKTIMSIAMSFTKRDLARMEDKQIPKYESEMFSFFEVFDKWVIAGGTFENGGLKSIQEIKFSNPDENSLKQIMKMFDLIFSAIIKNKSSVRDMELKEN